MLINIYILYILTKLVPDMPCGHIANLKLLCAIYWIGLSVKAVGVGAIMYNNINVLQFMNSDRRYLFFYGFTNFLNVVAYSILSGSVFREEPITKSIKNALLALFSFVFICDAIMYMIFMYFEKAQYTDLSNQVGLLKSLYASFKDLINEFINLMNPTVKI